MAEAAACVYCRQRPVDSRHRPFCSERCRMADLGRWLGGDYCIAAGPADPEPRLDQMPEPPEDAGDSDGPEA